MKIHQKLNLGFLSIIGPIILISLLAVWLIEDRLGRLSDFHSSTLFSIQVISSGTGNAIQESFAYVISGDTHEKEEFLLWQAEIAGQLEAFQRTAALGETGEEAEKALFDRIGSGVGLIIDEARNMFDAYESTGSVDAEVFTRYEAAIDQTFQALDALIEIERTEVTDSQEAALAVISLSENIVIVMLILGLVLTFVSARVIARFISRPLTQLRTASQALAQGDLDWKLEAASKDELGDLTHSFRHMAEQLKKSRDELEEQVRSRTLELQTTVEKLQEEVVVRKRAEEAMRESENRFQTLLREVDDVVWAAKLTDDGLEMLYANDACEILYGWPAADFMENSNLWMEVIHPDDQERVQQELGDFFAHGRIKQQYRIVRPDGAVRWVFDRKHLIFDEAGTPIWMGGLLTDITERKRAEEALRESEALYRTILDAVPQIIWQGEADGAVSYINQAWVDIIGMPKETALGSGWTTVIHPDDAPGLLAKWERAYAQGESYSGECRFLSKDGSYRTFDFVGLPVRDTSGEIIRWVGIDTDITERKQAEEALRESEERFQDLYNNAPVAYLAVGKDGRVRRANEQTVALLGYALDDLIGRPVFDLYADTPAGKEKARQVFQRFLGGESTHDEELQMRHADGHLTWVSLTVDPVRDADGEIIETRSIVIDITERLRAEQEIRSNAERFERWKASNFIGILQSNARGDIIDANDTLLAMLGYTRQDLVEGNLDWTKLTPPEFLHLDKTAIEEAADKGYWTPFEKEYFHKDDHRVPNYYWRIDIQGRP